MILTARGRVRAMRFDQGGAMQHKTSGWLVLLISSAVALIPAWSAGDEPAPGTLAPPPLAPSGPVDELPQVQVTAPEPRYVAPTRRDRIGRIWAPVLINGQGPFRMVLDTGANHSGVTARVAAALGIPLDQSEPVMLRGVTGSTEVPTIRVDSLIVGDLALRPAVLPIVLDALGGADGILGIEGLEDKRILIDFRHDLITINRSHMERAGRDFVALPMQRSRLGLVQLKAYVGGVAVKAILDTGGQATIGNSAMRNALMRHVRNDARAEEVIGVTTDAQDGESYPTPPIQLGTVRIQGARVTFGDMHIFEHWKMNDEPVLLIGMDTIGLLDTVIIDYRLQELQIRMRN